MKKQDVLSIFATFLVGFFAGGYFYLTNLAGFVSEVKTPDEEKVSEFIIVADVYGGCRDTCPSFQIQNDGTYRYLYTAEAGAEKVMRKGELPPRMLRQLRTIATVEALEEQSVPTEPPVCDSYTDGIDVEYEITLDGVVYTLDSCGTAVVGDGELWMGLQSIWDYFETGEK